MPYRAILITMVTVTLTLLAAGLWVRSISPLLVEVNASTQPSPEHPGITGVPIASGGPETSSKPAAVASTSPAHDPERPDKQFKALVRAVGIATILIVGALFAIGFFTTLRAWMRSSKHRKTRYVDAWKIAGERLAAKTDRESGEAEEDKQGL